MRIQSIDLVRGVAILGILLMNIYSHGMLEFDYVLLSPSPLSDKIVISLNALFFDGRFRTLLCLVFGAGLAIQYHKLNNEQQNYQALIKARLHWLLLFGFVHTVFIYAGDILFMYAVGALFIVDKLSLPAEEMRKKALVYISIGWVIGLLIACFAALFPEQEVFYRDSAEYLEAHNLWYGSYLYQIEMQFYAWLIGLAVIPTFFFLQISGVMLLGGYLYKTNFFTQGLSAKTMLKLCVIASLIIGLDIYLRMVNEHRYFLLSHELANISGLFVGLVYASFLVKLVQANNARVKLCLNWLANAGKLSLTLYLTQSICMAILLRYIMPEFHLTAVRVDYLLIAAVFIVIQLLCTQMYFKCFNQGPFEWLWRKLTLRTKLPKDTVQTETA
ncbi:DUF418 domain-containing protein [Catenovulum agarivorans]|uniref:DUF418 domain-containing protein n=1 Tax=Catenovulum agarivorans TaxID=1172192 RepID=UPI000309B198|nr:DUF418 domain-containing protein [Catenovulum agarivorans]